jgi:hypothetical protein
LAVPAKTCEGFCTTEVVASPKSHSQLVIIPVKPDGIKELSEKFTGLPVHLTAETEKSATGFGFTNTCCITESTQPFELIMDNFTGKVP